MNLTHTPTQLRSSVKVDLAVLGSPSLVVRMIHGHKATFKEEEEEQAQAQASELRSCVKVEVAVLGSPVPNSPYGLCGRKATLDERLN